jgi:hypothetical protein
MIKRRAYQTLLVLLLLISHVQCYVTVPRGVLPLHKQKAFLESLTNDVLLSNIGSLPPEQLKDTIPRLVDAWACHPVSPDLVPLDNVSNKSELKEKKNQQKAKRNQSDFSTTKHSTLQYSLTIEKLLKRLVDESYFSPELKDTAMSTELYNALLTSWERAATERCSNVQVAIAAAVRATTILVQMQELYEDQGTTQPNELSFRAVLSAWEGAVSLAVSSSNCDSSQIFDVVSHLHSIFHWMIDLYTEEKNIEVRNIVFDRDAFHSIMSLLAKHAGHRAAELCERMLQKMEHLDKHFALTPSQQPVLSFGDQLTSTISPDATTYNIILQAWAKSADIKNDSTNREIVANRAYQILSFMERRSHLEPNKRTYATAIHLLAKSGTKEHALKARKIITSLEQRFILSGGSQRDLLPDTMCYNHVINALAKSKDVHGIPHLAADMFQRMKSIHEDYNIDLCKPDVFSYSSLISAYSSVVGSKSMKRKAFALALGLWDDLRSNPHLGSANHVTYGALLRACALLPPESDEREEAVRRIFEQCKANGFVNSRVIDQLRVAASSSLFRELMSSRALTMEIPLDWKRQLVKDIR